MALPPPPDPIYTLRPHSGEVSCVQYADIGGRQSVLISTASGYTGVWDIETKREYWKKKCEKGVTSVQATQNGDVIILERHGHLSVWDIRNESEKFKLATPDPGFCNFAQLSSTESRGQLIALANSEFGQINVFDITTGKYITKLSVEEPKSVGMIMCLHSLEGQCLLAGCESGNITLFDIRQTDKELSSLKLHSEPVLCVDFDNTRNHGACGSPSKTLEAFSISQEKTLHQTYSVELRNSGVSSVRIRHDGRIMCSGGWDNRIRIFGCKKGKPLAVLDFHTDTVQSVSFASSTAPEKYNNLLICGSKDQRVTLWRLY